MKIDFYELLTKLLACSINVQVTQEFARYAECGMEHFVFEFLLNYVRRIKSDKDWRKLLKKNPEKPFLLFVTPSDIAHILALIKNGMGVWDQARRMDGKDRNSQGGEKKVLPLFTKGEGQKRESGKTVWNNEGLNFYYTAELNWKKVYNDRDEFSDLCNKWERWEPEDKYKKNPVRTYWRRHEEQKDDIEQEEVPVEWWEEQHVGYLEEGDDEPVFEWSEEIIRGNDDFDGTHNKDDGGEEHEHDN